MLCLLDNWNVGNFKFEFKDKDKVSAYEYAIIVSRSVLAKIIIFSAHFPFTFLHTDVGITLARLYSRVSYNLN